MRFVSHDIWPDKGCVIWRFLHCRFVQIVSLWSLSTWIRIIFNTKESINWINAEIKCPTGDILKNLDFLVRKNASQSKTYEAKCAAGKICLTESWWVVCPVYLVYYSLSMNHSSETYWFDKLMNVIIHPLIKLGQAESWFVCHTGEGILLIKATTEGWVLWIRNDRIKMRSRKASRAAPDALPRLPWCSCCCNSDIRVKAAYSQHWVDTIPFSPYSMARVILLPSGIKHLSHILHKHHKPRVETYKHVETQRKCHKRVWRKTVCLCLCLCLCLQRMCTCEQNYEVRHSRQIGTHGILKK